MRPGLTLAVLLFALAFCVAQDQKMSAAQRSQPIRKSLQGATLYQQHCAACHGNDGRGGGPAAAALKHTAPDLTLIAQRNHGKFPYREVKAVIEGTEAPPSAHGNREMPVWGPVFHEVEADQDWGEVRLDAVTRHIESIQQK